MMASLSQTLFLIIVLSISHYCNAINLFGMDLNQNHSDMFSTIMSTANQIASEKLTRSVDKFVDDQVKNDFLHAYSRGLVNQEIYHDFKQLVDTAGYKVEEHTVITDDGYILTVYRIPGDGQPVLLNHGTMNCADDWVTLGKNRALPYLLLEDGYDVWFANARGNKYSRRHLHMSPISPEFWDFTWHEIGIYDLPVIIDCVLEKTNSEKLHYIGHSQGTTSYLVLQSERPEYNDKIHVAVMLSTVAWMTHIKSPFTRLIVPFSDISYAVGQELGIYELGPRNILTDIVQDIFCDTDEISNIICTNLNFLTFGFDYEQVDPERLPIILSHAPSSAAMKQIIHYAQEIKSGHFRQFDHGETKNKEIYGSEQPPDYPIEKITSPLAIFYSVSDWFSNITDVKNVLDKAPNVVDYYKVPCDTYNHQDYLWAKDIKTLEYPRIKLLFEKYGKE